MSWNLKGRKAIESLEPNTRRKVLSSHTMNRCLNKPLLWVIEEMIDLEVVSGLSGPLKKVDYFLCLVARLLQITPPPGIVLVMLRQDVHKYLRVGALFVIRLIGNVRMQKEAMSIGFEDYRKIRVYGDEETLQIEKEGEKRAREEELEMGLRPPLPPHYFIMRLDEITDGLFLPKKKGALGPKSFLGLPLPTLII